MDLTSTSLLWRAARGDEPSWSALSELYGPLVRNWLGRVGLSRRDVADVTQDVMATLVAELHRFEHAGRAGAFRAWLRVVTVNCARVHWRKVRRQPVGTGDTAAHALLDELASDQSQASRQWDREHDEYVLRSLMERIRGEFDPKTMRAFESLMVRGLGAAEAAAELGMSAGAVYVAKSRVLRRLREEAAGLIDEV